MRLGTNVAQTHNASSPCPTCLGLDAQQRPRYFSGQLLTEAELNSEQAYMRAKLQLHNRYLHGSGIVCGLQVSCSDSAGFVTIQPGYAIDSCGNDIIVSSPQQFNLLKSIQEYVALRKRQRRTGCDPIQPPVDPPRQDMAQHYCLTIAYQEQEVRPINALRQASTTNCEPTRIMESYQLAIVEVPANYCDDLQSTLADTLWTKAIACITTLKKFIDQRLINSIYTVLTPLAFAGDTDASPQALYDACCRLRQTVYDLYTRDPLNTHSTALNTLSLVVCPPPPSGQVTAQMQADYTEQIRTTLYHLLALLIQYTLDGIGQALTPLCPANPTDEQLILACITVQGNQITDLCACQRHYAGAFPTLSHWLSLVPLIPLITYAIQRIGCYDWLTPQQANEEPDGAHLTNGLLSLLNEIDPSRSLLKALFADNLAWPKSYITGFEQLRNSFTPGKIIDRLHPQAFNLATILDKPVDKPTTPPEVSEMQKTINDLKEQLAALQGEVEKLKTNQTPPPNS